MENHKMVALCACVLLASIVSYGESIYMAQTAQGSDNGVNAANAHSAVWFNTAGNWGTGADKIGAGDTVRLCGTFTGAVNTTMLTLRGSGVSGNPIMILFEPGAKLESPCWGETGAVYLNGQSHIIMDGGTTCGRIDGATVECNGIIRNTLAGESGLTCPGGPCSIALDTYTKKTLIYDNGNPADIEIRNLRIGPVYVRELNPDSGGFNTDAVYFGMGLPHNIRVHNNSITGAARLITVAWSDGASGNQSGFYFYNNELCNHCWAIGMGANSDFMSASDIQIHDNEVYDWRWAQDGMRCHGNGFMLYNGWGVYPNRSIGDSTCNIYNNYLHGSLMGGSTSGGASGFISCQDNCGPINVFNNLIVDTETGDGAKGLGGGIYFQQVGSGGQKVFNNTIVRPGGACIYASGDRWGKVQIKNNILIGGSAINTYKESAAVAIADYNLGYGISPWLAYNLNVGFYVVPLSTWQSTYGQDVHSIMGDPELDDNYRPMAGSPAIGAGVNLADLGISALNVDALGNPRPATGAWDIGAFQYTGNPGIRSQPPNGGKSSFGYARYNNLPFPQNTGAVVFDLKGRKIGIGKLKETGIYFVRGPESMALQRVLIVK